MYCGQSGYFLNKPRVYGYVYIYTRFVPKVSGLTTVHEADKAYGVLTLIVFNIITYIYMYIYLFYELQCVVSSKISFSCDLIMAW